MDYEIIDIKSNPNLIEEMASWFSYCWDISRETYLESMKQALTSKDYPNWYVAISDNKIIGGLGVIQNDFHYRKDLYPNVCAVYVETKYRRQGIAGKLLERVCDDMQKHGINTLYLITNHTGFYERYGWKYCFDIMGDRDEEPSRVYIHEANDEN